MEELGVVATGEESADSGWRGSPGHGSNDATSPANAGIPRLGGVAPVTKNIGYVSKFPPSPSGIALYASVFERVLQKFGTVERVPAPADPRQSQRLVSALHGFLRGLRDGRAGRYSTIHVELGGRSLFEFYYALGALRSCRTPVTITCHDTPSLVGQPCLFTILDRRGLRRLGALLSSHLGSTWEERLVSGASEVLCLTGAGAAALSHRFGRPVSAIPHVVDDPGPLREKQHRVFLPGYLSDPGTITAVVSGVASLNREKGTSWQVVVGACPPEVAANLGRSLPRDQRAMVTFAGYQTEDDLLREFLRARVVVRIRGNAGEANSFAASGPLAWAAARGCVILTDDRRAGAQELAHLGLATYSAHPLDDLLHALEEAADPGRADLQARRAQELFGAAAVAQEITTAASHDRTTPRGAD